MTPRTRRAFAAFALWLAAGGASAEEWIRDFRSDLRLHEDGSFTVEERIVYEFGDAQRHGIYRDIPVRYGRGNAPDYRIALEVVSVTDAGGRARRFAVSSEGVYRRIRIGDPKRTVTGSQEYRIAYRVGRGILWFDDHDELYWNATGTEWKVPIRSSGAGVRLPGRSRSVEVESACFTGRRGSVASDCSAAVSGDSIDFASDRPLGPNEGLTLVVGLPKGVLEEPSDFAKLIDRASDYVSWATAIPVFAFFSMGLVWWQTGRDPSGPVAIPVRYEPPEGMSPAEMGTVLDERADIDDITSTILDLAVRGYLEIEELEGKSFLFLSETDYELREVKPADDDLRPHEKELFSALLGGRKSVRLSDLRNEFYTKLPGLEATIYEQVSGRGKWFPVSPDHVRRGYSVLAVGILILGGVLGAVFKFLAIGVSLVACGGIVLAFGRVMPRKTRKGRRAHQHIQGFREFIERVEVDRLERLGMREISQFEKLLPYAFVLGAADAWAEAFADLYTEPPSWYHSRSGGRFRPRRFVADVGRSLRTTGDTLQSRPRGSGSSGMGGGGFSGGGFGGGGGGSW